MNDQRYKHTQDQILEIAKMTIQLDIPGFLERISTAEAVAPILDPTLYIKASKNMAEIKMLAEGLIDFSNTVEALKEKAVKELQRKLA